MNQSLCFPDLSCDWWPMQHLPDPSKKFLTTIYEYFHSAVSIIMSQLSGL